MKDGDPTARELAAGLGHKKRGRIQVAPVEDRTWIAPDGMVHIFDSAHEMDHYLRFVALERCGAISELTRQVRYPLHSITPNGCPIEVTSYTADWTCKDRAGRLSVYDPKGLKTDRFRLVKKMVEVEYGIRIIEL